MREDWRVLTRPRLTIIAAALVAGPIAVWIVLASEHDDNAVRTAVLMLVVSWSFLVAGLVALARTPGRFGSLMCAVGLAVYLTALGDANASVPHTIGMVVGSLWIAILVHALVAFPTGRLPTRGAVVTVAAAYAVLTVGQLLVILFDDLADECPDCPDNAVLITADDTVASVVDAVVGTIGAVIAAAVVVTLVRRWRSASEPLRRALAPVLWTGAAGSVAIGLSYAAFVVAPGLDDVPVWAALVLLVAFPFAFLAGLLRMRLARAAVSRLVVELGETPPEGKLRDALSRALHDPDLAVAYWRTDARGFVDAAGQTVELPRDGTQRTASVIERGGEPVAALIHDASLVQDPELVEAVAAAAGLALENERLQAALLARLEDLRASRARIVEAQATERRRLERNLHDGAQQRLVALALELGRAEARLDDQPAQARELLGHARGELRQAIDELREIARGIHPALLTDRGLGPALEALADRAPLPVSAEVELGDGRLPDAIEVAAYYVAAEALTNVVKYARASEATIRATREPDHAAVEVADDGSGGADPARGSGLRGLADRVDALGGRLEVLSPRGGGTRVRATFPLAREAGESAAATPAMTT
jgi:signal transduction histidine kinase